MTEPRARRLQRRSRRGRRAHLLRAARARRRSAPRANPRDLVTEWDLRTEELIRARARSAHAPGIPVLGEEAGRGRRRRRRLRWLVDPIDGTVNFAHGLPMWACRSRSTDRGTVLAVVVVAPALGWWFEATRGGGARDAQRRTAAR